MADISKINPNGTEYDIKDAVARGMVEGSKTATGNPITLTDASETYAQGLSVELEPVQDLHGYDFPWVGGAGKNLFDPPVISSAVSRGVTFSADKDGKITANGTSTGTSDTCYVELQQGFGSLRLGETYKIVSNGNIYFNVLVQVEGAYQKIVNTSLSAEFTIPNNATDFLFRAVAPYNGAVYTNAVSYPVIMLATETDPTFAPYSNICPISGYEGVEVETADSATDPTQSRTASVTFGQTVYGGSVDFLTGVLTVDTVKLALGTLSWATYSSANMVYYSDAISDIADDKTSICDCYNSVQSSPADLGNGEYRIFTNNRFYIRDINYSGPGAFKTHLTDDNVYATYKLATPQTYQLAPAELKLLKEQNTITSNGTTISLKYQPDNVIGEAIGVSEEYTDRKVNGKTYTKTVTGTVWVNAQSARMLILYNESEAWDRIPIAAFYSTYKCTPYYVYENDTYTWSILIHKSDGTNATDISSGASITLQVVYMEA